MSKQPTLKEFTSDEKEKDVPALASGAHIAVPVLQDQAVRLPFRKLALVYISIGMGLALSFMDQTSVSTAAPVIGAELAGSASISWVGTSFFLANCAFHLVYGRLSDIFGRKIVLQTAIGILCLGNLLCGFARTPIYLYVFRALAGVGGGGVVGIAMVIVSDVVPLKDRGKYQGFISAACSLGNAVGPFVGGGLAGSGRWRWVFWITTILGGIVIMINQVVLPLRPVSGSIKVKLRQIDYFGLLFSIAGTVLILVPLSGGGSTFPWRSPVTISLLVIGGLCALAFLWVEGRVANIPVLPLRLFSNRNATVGMIVSYLTGVSYYGNVFYVPIYLQYVRGYSPLVAGALVLVYTLPQSIWGISSGWYVSRTNHYKIVLVIGTAVWTLSLGVQLLWTPSTGIGQVLGCLELGAVGIGSCMQTTLILTMSTTAPEDRAVATAARNFFRTLGGACGLAIAAAVYANTVAKVAYITPEVKATLLRSGPSALGGMSERTLALAAINSGTRMVFALLTAANGLAFASTALIREVAFEKDSPELQAQARAAKGTV